MRGRAGLHPSRESRGDVEGPRRLGLESRPAPEKIVKWQDYNLGMEKSAMNFICFAMLI